jgi:integrase/recombinase XerC
MRGRSFFLHRMCEHKIYAMNMMVEKFLEYLKYERNYSPMTLKSYEEDLTAFESYFKNLDENLTWKTVDADIIRDWMESMMDRGNKATSINRRLSAIRSLFRFALSRNLVECDPAHSLAGPKKSKPLPSFLKERELDMLLDNMKTLTSYKDVLMRTVIMTFYETGIRLAELCGLRDKDVDFDSMQLKVTGKRNKQRIIPFGEELKTTLGDYMSRRNHDIQRETDSLFVSDKGKPVSDNQIRYEVGKWLSTVSTARKRSPHVLRHTFATVMLNHQAGLESIKQLLGHQNLETTEIYTHTTFEQLKKVYTSAHPRA